MVGQVAGEFYGFDVMALVEEEFLVYSAATYRSPDMHQSVRAACFTTEDLAFGELLGPY